MSHSNHTRHGFIPAHILEKMAKSGSEFAKESLLEAIRRRRESSVSATSKGISNTGDSLIRIYDSADSEEFQVNLELEEGGPIHPDHAINNSYEHANTTKKFFKEILNRDSIDNAGMDIIINVHFGENLPNAFWWQGQMSFGDGDNQMFSDFTESLDVMAHELSHGVCESTAQLIYEGQSGALNEHFSDVFGMAVVQWATKQEASEADWLIGADVMGEPMKGEALRSMKDPGTAYGNEFFGYDDQVSHMSDFYDGPEDNGGVHWNSGIPNKAFYLTAMEIGTINAAKIWYQAMQRLWPQANFYDALFVILQTAKLLVREKHMPRGSVQAIRSAFKTVGLTLR